MTWQADAERACVYVIERGRAAHGRLFHQGARHPPLPTQARSPALRFVAEQRMFRVSTAVARALVAWGDGFPVELLYEVPSPEHVLALQARGRRCVSLLADDAVTHPHADALAFTIHDLCHLDKFIDARHHRGEVGFFASLHRAVERPEWVSLETDFDLAFAHDWRHVAADMNGSAVFLFAALKMKLKMAVRRRIAGELGRPPDCGGPLTEEETRAFARYLEILLDLLRLYGDIAEAARRTSARRDDPIAARVLLSHFEEVGAQVPSDYAGWQWRESNFDASQPRRSSPENARRP